MESKSKNETAGCATWAVVLLVLTVYVAFTGKGPIAEQARMALVVLVSIALILVVSFFTYCMVKDWQEWAARKRREAEDARRNAEWQAERDRKMVEHQAEELRRQEEARVRNERIAQERREAQRIEQEKELEQARQREREELARQEQFRIQQEREVLERAEGQAREQEERKRQELVAREREALERTERERHHREQLEKAYRDRPAARNEVLIAYAKVAPLISRLFDTRRLQEYLIDEMGDHLPLEHEVQEAGRKVRELFERLVAQESVRRTYQEYEPAVACYYSPEILEYYLSDSMGDHRSLKEVQEAGAVICEQLGQLYIDSPRRIELEREARVRIEEEEERARLAREEAELRAEISGMRQAGLSEEMIELHMADRKRDRRQSQTP